MQETEKIGLHSTYLLFGNILITLLSFVITVFITIKLGPTAFGIYSFVISIFFFLSPIALFGLSSILQRNTSFYYGKKDLGAIKGYTITTSKIVLCSTSVIAVAVVLVSLLFPNFLVYTDFILISIPFFFLTVFYTFYSSGFLTGTRKFGLAVFFDVFSKVLILLVLVVLIDMHVQGVILANTIGVFIPLVILIFVLLKFFSNVKTKQVHLKSYMSMSLQYFVAQTIFGILLYLNIFVLTYFIPSFGIEEVGFYSLASNVEFYLENFLMFIGFAITPAIIQYYGENNLQRVQKIFSLGFKYTFLLVFPVLFSLISAADVIVSDIFTKSYSGSVPILQILAFTFLATMMLRLLLPIVLAKNFVKLYLYLAIVLLTISLPLTFFLTSEFSSIGAAVSRVVPIVLGTFIFVSVVTKKAKLPLPLKFLMLEFLSASIFLLLFIAPRNIFFIAVSFLGLLAVYLGILFVVGVIDKSDINRVISFLNSLRNSL